MAALRSETGIEVAARRNVGLATILRLVDGSQVSTRRFTPVGKGDRIREQNDQLEVWVRNDRAWIPLSAQWKVSSTARIGGEELELTFKEIETSDELRLFDNLRKFHYRGGGGAGRTVPLIAVAGRWDVPQVLGFVELTSSMIASTARKRFMSGSFFESREVQWQVWNSVTAGKYGNLICRISRFVIHPELRGSGLASYFFDAAENYAASRWHYGGWRPRFVEITADMLRYYNFVSTGFASMGTTEGNEHRVVRDMEYLVKKALTEGQKMPQGGGGIMTLQRGYAARLLEFTSKDDRGVAQLVQQISGNPASLDQATWEALYKLNRRPKPSYIRGLTGKAKEFVRLQDIRINSRSSNIKPKKFDRAWTISDLCVLANSAMEQTTDGRAMQEAFGFVGSRISSHLINGLNITLRSGEVSLICGASGSGKSLLLEACRQLLDPPVATLLDSNIKLAGTASGPARVKSLPSLPLDVSAISLKATASLERFMEVAAKCGLAEPQLLVRPIRSLSSGQRYRLAIALALLGGCEVLLIDNFCEPLDRYTASAVAKGLRRLAREEGVCVLAATAAYDRSYLLDEVDQIALLRRGGEATVVRCGQNDDLQKSILDHPLPDQGPE